MHGEQVVVVIPAAALFAGQKPATLTHTNTNKQDALTALPCMCLRMCTLDD